MQLRMGIGSWLGFEFLWDMLKQTRELTRPRHRIGPGVKSTRIARGPRKYTDINGAHRYDGAHLRAIRAEKGVGRPPHPKFDVVFVEPEQWHDIEVQAALLDPAAQVAKYGSQRKAAAALGISLGKLQRELRKAA